MHVVGKLTNGLPHQYRFNKKIFSLKTIKVFNVFDNCFSAAYLENNSANLQIHSIEAVSRYCNQQFQVTENYLDF